MRPASIITVFVMLALTRNYCSAQGEVKLTADGKALFNVVVASDATVPEQNAAKELVLYLKQVSGVDFCTYALGNEPTGTPRILVGQSDTAKRLLKINWQSLKYDGIVIRFVGKDVVLAGDRPRGSVYAVHSFLEDYVGCKWWTAAASFIPRKANLTVKPIDKTHIPPFMCREIYYQPVNYKAPDFSIKLKLNGTHQPAPQDFGGSYRLIGFVHTMNRLLPPTTYFKDHPEWYALVNNKRTPDTQLCLTNDEMKEELIKQAMKWIAEDPSAGMISISQNDCFGPCQCEKCQAIVKAEGSEAGPLIAFVNSVAEEIEKKYPDFLIETLAYQYTRKAPKTIRPRDNVIIRLCSIECDFATPLTSKANAGFYKDIVDWKTISKRLYVWDYVVNFGNLLLPYPNWRVLAPNIRIFADNHVAGLFEQGDGFNKDSAFGNMKVWVVAHLMWDKSLDAHTLMKEFAEGYYGLAAPQMIQYLDLLSDAVETDRTYLGCFIGNGMPYMNQSVMDKANDLFDKAEKSVKNNPVLLERVKLERLALDHAWIIQPALDRSRFGKARDMDMKAVCEDYINRGIASCNDYISEGRKIPDSVYASLRSNAALPPIPAAKRIPSVPLAAKGLRKSDWIDVQQDRMNLHRPGVCSEIVYDKDASDARAVRMPGSTNEWATQIWFRSANLPADKRVTAYASMKVKKKAAAGVAFIIGIYDTAANRSVLYNQVELADVDHDGYIEYKIGTYVPDDDWYIFIAPPGNADLVDSVLVDRIFYVKHK